MMQPENMDMDNLFIDEGGEMRLGSEVLGTIHWAGPCAHYGVAGGWEREGGSDCDCCFGNGVDPDAYDDLEEERDKLADDLEKSNALAESLRRALSDMIDPYDRAAGNAHMPEYQAATVVLTARDGADG